MLLRTNRDAVSNLDEDEADQNNVRIRSKSIDEAGVDKTDIRSEKGGIYFPLLFFIPY